ncbi:hypothetical protein PHMEG_00022381 [Phytophthora megakarya]|uniref:Uncharacterized protein n=1 Tax=Phytophthora megakarya TaxID=4795 RepID=A0A225VIX1_9STRA|nr:hypothetical protein PHMEG_00022381 [Phytophthora megakarya]
MRYLTSTEQRGVIGKSTFGNVRSVIVYLFTHTDLFGHLFLLVCWNLMCRAKSTENIRHAHLAWREDSTTIYFAHMKNDQDGSPPRDPRNVYANPIMPEICQVWGFGIYFAVLGLSLDGKPLLLLDCWSNKLKTGFRSKQIPTREEHAD